MKTKITKKKPTPAEAAELAEVRAELAEARATVRHLGHIEYQALNFEMRCWLAGNLSTPKSVLEFFKNDPDARVRRCLADNRSAPAAVLEFLENDTDPETQWLAGKQKLKAPTKLRAKRKAAVARKLP